jgi:hypothetical protein
VTRRIKHFIDIFYLSNIQYIDYHLLLSHCVLQYTAYTAMCCNIDDEDSDKEEQEEGFIAPEAVEAPVKGRK